MVAEDLRVRSRPAIGVVRDVADGVEPELEPCRRTNRGAGVDRSRGVRHGVAIARASR